MHLQQLLKDLLATHGYWVLFIGTFLEGEAILIMAGFLAFQGYLALPWVIITSFFGSFLGDQFYFYLGRAKGKQLLKRFHSIARKFREALRLIEKYGSLVAFISRYTYGLRIVLPIILGVTNLPPKRFLWLNLVSALSWAVLFSCAGYLYGKSAELLLEDVSRYEPWLMLALLGFIALAWCLHFLHAWNLKRPARTRLKNIRKIRAQRSRTSE
jgi:membrane protein DedA with SNARE-associated domain